MNPTGRTLSRRAALVALPLGTFGLGYALGRRAPPRRWNVASAGGLGTEPALHFLALGDTGYDSEERRAVVAQMRDAVERYSISFALLLGDVAYPDGITSADDPQWKTHFETPFCEGVPGIPYYVVAGNHDKAPQAFLDYARRNPRLRMPAPHYDFQHATIGGAVSASFHALDTQAIRQTFLGRSPQVAWLRESLRASRANWRVVVSHHAMLSGGTNGGSPKVRFALEDVLERGGVDLVVSGHDHDLELLDPGSSWVQVVSGGGSSARPVEEIGGTRFARQAPGFAVVALRSRSIGVEFWTASEGPVAAFELAPSYTA